MNHARQGGAALDIHRDIMYGIQIHKKYHTTFQG